MPSIADMDSTRAKNQTRHLRRRAYQDMVFSLKQSGLNPMLAVGAQPGYATSYPPSTEAGNATAAIGGASDLASTAMNAAKTPTAIDQAKAGARYSNSAASLADAETSNKPYERGNMVLEGELLAANRHKTDAERIVAEKDAGLKDKEAAKKEIETLQLRKDYNASVGGNILADPAGYAGNIVEKAWQEIKPYVTSAKDETLKFLEDQAAKNRDWKRRQDAEYNRRHGR